MIHDRMHGKAEDEGFSNKRDMWYEVFGGYSILYLYASVMSSFIRIITSFLYVYDAVRI